MSNDLNPNAKSLQQQKSLQGRRRVAKANKKSKKLHGSQQIKSPKKGNLVIIKGCQTPMQILKLQ
jgi:hypothetical protein